MYRLYTKNIADENNARIVFERPDVAPSILPVTQSNIPADLPAWSSRSFSVPVFNAFRHPIVLGRPFSVVVGAMSLFQTLRTSVTRSPRSERPADGEVRAEDHSQRKEREDPYRDIVGRGIFLREHGEVAQDTGEVYTGQKLWRPLSEAAVYPGYEQGRESARAFLPELFPDTWSAEGLLVNAEEDVPEPLYPEFTAEDRPVHEKLRRYDDEVAFRPQGSAAHRIGMLNKASAKVETFSVASVSRDVPTMRAGLLREATADTAKVVTGDELFVQDVIPDLSRPELVQFIGPFFRRNSARVDENGRGELSAGHDENIDANGGVDEVSNSGDQRNTGTGG